MNLTNAELVKLFIPNEYTRREMASLHEDQYFELPTIIRSIPPYKSTQKIPFPEKTAYLKYTNLDGAEIYVIEFMEKETNFPYAYTFGSMESGGEFEGGDLWLSDPKYITGQGLELDLFFKPTKIKDIDSYMNPYYEGDSSEDSDTVSNVGNDVLENNDTTVVNNLVDPNGVNPDDVVDISTESEQIKSITEIEVQNTMDSNEQFGVQTIQNTDVDQMIYSPMSDNCNSVDTTIPLNQRYELLTALHLVNREVNGVDEYVREKLQYSDVKNLCEAMSSEQVDALALAIYNMEVKRQGVIVADMTGTGKGRSQPVDSKILTPNGWVLMGELKVGDEVYSVDGKPTKVLNIYPQGEIDTYEILFKDGSRTECSYDHLWNVVTRDAKHNLKNNPESEYGKFKTVSLGDLITENKLNRTYSIPIADRIQFESKEVVIDPYLLGLIIGDGYCRKNGIQVVLADEEIKQSFESLLPNELTIKFKDRYHYDIVKKTGNKSYLDSDNSPSVKNNYTRESRRLGISNVTSSNKFIPDLYKINSVEVRLSVLQGLLDSDGYINKKGSIMFYTVSNTLANDVEFIVRSLGGNTTRGLKKEPSYKNKLGEKIIGKPCHVVYIKMPNDLEPFRLSRKAERVNKLTKYLPQRIIKEINLIGKKECQCIRVEHESHLYVTDDFIVTHNTSAGLMRYGLKRNIPVIFLTEKMNLFTDIYRDMKDIAVDDAVPYELRSISSVLKKRKLSASDLEDMRNEYLDDDRLEEFEALKDESGDIYEEYEDVQYTKNPFYNVEGFTPVVISDKNNEFYGRWGYIQNYNESMDDHLVYIIDLSDSKGSNIKVDSKSTTGFSFKGNPFKFNKEKFEVRGRNKAVPFIFNNSATIFDAVGNKIYKTSELNNKIYQDVKDGFFTNLKDYGFDFAISTYSQFSKGAEESSKGLLMKAISDGAIFVLDEAHNASGKSNTGKFFKEILNNAEGVTFLSATYAKRPDNMAIYATKTALSDATMTDEELEQAIVSGGEALQEIVSSQLAREGQLIRRQRSFEGIETNYLTLDKSIEDLYPQLNLEEEHKAVANKITGLVRDIIEFQTKELVPYFEGLNQEMQDEYTQRGFDPKDFMGGIDRMPTFSGIFNLINQMLLSIKADAIATVAIERMKQGKKPVIALANTMESFFDKMTDENGNVVKIGDTIKTDFQAVLKARLASVLRYSETDEFGNKERHELDVNLLSDEAQKSYYDLLDKIEKTSIGIHISPIDVIIEKIQNAGYSVLEVTKRGRKIVSTADGYGILKPNKINPVSDSFRSFNANETDCLIINQSGATGASAHSFIQKGVVDVVNYDENGNPIVPTSLENKREVKQRVMIVLQAELDINKEVQKRGRINRTGQVFKPIYDYITSSIPAEKRLMMMLKKKLKSLDANTTSNQKTSKKLLSSKQSASDVDQMDFLNKYGDTCVVEYLIENQGINRLLENPMKLSAEVETIEDVKSEILGASNKVSGRVAILDTTQQENYYNDVSNRYLNFVNYLNDIDENDLEVKDLKLDAKVLSREVFVIGNPESDSNFAKNSILEECEVNVLRKPFTLEQVSAMIQDACKLVDENGHVTYLSASEMSDYLVGKAKEYFAKRIESTREIIRKSFEKKREGVEKIKSIKAIKDEFERQKAIETILNEYEVEMSKEIDESDLKIEQNRRKITSLLAFFKSGMSIGYPSQVDKNTYNKGVFVGFDINMSYPNPFAPSSMTLKFAFVNSLRSVSIPASKTEIISQVREFTSSNYSWRQDYVLKDWENLTKESSAFRSKRYIITGNILQAMGHSDAKFGKLVSYTTHNGGIKKGILMPEYFNPNGSQMKKGSSIKIPLNVGKKAFKFLSTNQTLNTDGLLSVERSYYGFNIYIDGKREKKKAQEIVTNPNITKFIDTAQTRLSEFKVISGLYRTSISNADIEDFVTEYYRLYGGSLLLTQSQFQNMKDELGLNIDSQDEDESTQDKQDADIIREINQRYVDFLKKREEKLKEEQEKRKVEAETEIIEAKQSAEKAVIEEINEERSKLEQERSSFELEKQQNSIELKFDNLLLSLKANRVVRSQFEEESFSFGLGGKVRQGVERIGEKTIEAGNKAREFWRDADFGDGKGGAKFDDGGQMSLF